jgi:hypothetical protein
MKVYPRRFADRAEWSAEVGGIIERYIATHPAVEHTVSVAAIREGQARKETGVGGKLAPEELAVYAECFAESSKCDTARITEIARLVNNVRGRKVGAQAVIVSAGLILLCFTRPPCHLKHLCFAHVL